MSFWKWWGTIFEEAGRPLRVQAAPKILLRAIGLFNAQIRETIGMLYEFEEPFVVDHCKFERTFGQRATPLEEAIAGVRRSTSGSGWNSSGPLDRN